MSKMSKVTENSKIYKMCLKKANCLKVQQPNMLSLWSGLQQPNMHSLKSDTVKLRDLELALQLKFMIHSFYILQSD